MTRYSKILVVFVSVASLGFVGFAIATTFGGPDWSNVIGAKFFDGYALTRSEGADPTWQAIRASDQGQVKSSQVLPEVLTGVMDDVLRRQQQELASLREREPHIKAKIEQLKQLSQADEQALKNYIQNLNQRLAAVNQTRAELAQKVTGMSVEASKLESQVDARRDDVTRLGQQVLEVEADIFRLNQVASQLQDAEFQLQEQLDRATERQKLLDYNPPPSDSEL